MIMASLVNHFLFNQEGRILVETKSAGWLWRTIVLYLSAATCVEFRTKINMTYDRQQFSQPMNAQRSCISLSNESWWVSSRNACHTLYGKHTLYVHTPMKVKMFWVGFKTSRGRYTGVDCMYNHVHCVCVREFRQLGVKAEWGIETTKTYMRQRMKGLKKKFLCSWRFPWAS